MVGENYMQDNMDWSYVCRSKKINLNEGLLQIDQMIQFPADVY